MSMQNWCTHGYGFRFDDHKDDLTLEGIQRLLEQMEKDGCPMKQAYASYFRKMGITDPQVEDYEETAAMCIQRLDSLQKTNRTPVNVCA